MSMNALALPGSGFTITAAADINEFGQIAENVVDGNGYAYFPADDEGPLPAERADAK